MDYQQIKQFIAPCGLNCAKCFAYTQGDIAQHSKQLKELLGGFDAYAERFVDMLKEPVFSKYPAFKELLHHFSSGQCNGCRNEKCKLYKDCKVRECHENKSVDFCYQCSDFPCNHTGFDKHLQERFVKNNLRMKEVGVGVYFSEIKDKPRY